MLLGDQGYAGTIHHSMVDSVTIALAIIGVIATRTVFLTASRAGTYTCSYTDNFGRTGTSSVQINVVG